MHAVVATVRIEDLGPARAALAEKAAAYPLPPLPGVTPLTLEIREVYARA